MKITGIHLTRFKRFERVDISIPDDAEFICITGPNGSGKSTLLNAQEFTLYGVSGGLSADHIVSSFAEPGERCEVGLDFTHSGHNYTVLRTFRKGKSVQHDAVIRCDGEVRATGVTAVEAEVIRTIGLTAKDFNTVVYSKQDDLRAITDIRPGERKEWFGKSFGVNFIKAESEKILKEKIKETEQAIATLQGELSVLSRQDPAELDATRASLADLQQKIIFLKADEEGQQKQRDDLSGKLQEHNLKTVRQGKLADQMHGLNNEITALSLRVDGMSAQMESLAVSEQDLLQLDETVKRIPAARGEIEEYRTKKAAIEKLTIERSAMERERNNILDRIKKVLAELVGIDAGEIELTGLESKVRTTLGFSADKNVDDAVSEYQERVAGKSASINARVETIESEIARLKSNLVTLMESGREGACPLCCQGLGDHFDQVKNEYLDKIGELAQEREELDEALDAALEDTHTIPNLKPTLDRIRQIRGKNGYKGSYEEEKKTLAEKSKTCEDSIALLTQEIAKVAYNGEDHDACRQRLVELEAAQIQYTDLTKRSKEHASHRALIAELNSQITTKNAALAEVKAAIDKDPIILSDGPILEHEVQKLDLSLKSLAQDLATSAERERTLTQKVADLEKAAASIGTVQQQLAALNSELEVLTLTRAAIGDYVLYLMQVMRSAIETEVGAILTDITDGKYSRMIVDEEFNLLIQEGDKEYTLDRYSGGEQDVIALALRMALSNILPKLHGVFETFPFLIDEGLSSLDPERKENTIQAMRVQAKRCRQVFNNTHDQNVVGDYNLRVQANGPVSTVQVGV